jgi:hypothetical protein
MSPENSAIPAIRDTIVFSGHRNIMSLHANSIELTMESEISRRADCIIGVRADKACAQLKTSLKNHIRHSGSLKFALNVGARRFIFYGRGSPELSLADPIEIVLRKSYFSSMRTGAIRCSAAAIDVPRSIVKLLQTPEQIGILEIEAIKNEADALDTVRWTLPD